MAELVYVLCALMSTVCAFMLLSNYRRTGFNLLLWSGLCFVGLALNNIVLVVDLLILPGVEFNGALWRSVMAASSGGLLIFGLIWELA